MTDRLVLNLSLAMLAAVFCAACASSISYGARLGRPEVRNIVETEVQSVRDIGVQEDFVDWSVTSIVRTPAPPDLEDARSEVAQGYHRFVRAIVGYALGRGHSSLTASTGRKFLRQSVKCGVIPCDTRKCCDFCRRLCTQKEPLPDPVASLLTLPAACSPDGP